MWEEKFALRLTQLRMNKDVSARDMSLSLGQNPGYIFSIESGKSLPSMSNFFYICEYLGVTPAEFFTDETEDPITHNELSEKLNKLSKTKMDKVLAIVDELIKK